MDAVDQVLAHRARRLTGAPNLASLGAAALLHAVVLAALWIAPSLSPERPPLEFVPVQIIPAQALGVERPLGRPKREEARPKPVEPAPEPAPEKPEPEKPPEPERPQAVPEPKPEPPKPRDDRPEPPRAERAERPEIAEPRPAGAEKRPPRETPAAPRDARKPQPGAAEPATGKTGPGGVAAVGKGEELGRRGSSSGNPLGTSAFGSSIAGLEDPNFGYGYYIDRLLQLIDANWTRPPVGSELRTVLTFRILRNGSIEDLDVEESSGHNAFDLAALRAVQNASPFPALPASYRHPSLGVHLIVH